MDKSEFEELRTEFLRHEAICEERWKTVFNEIRDAKEQGNARWTEVRASFESCLLYTSPSPRDVEESRMPSSA